MRKVYETALILFGTLGWWGFVYPELSLGGDRYEQEAEAEEAADQNCAMKDTGQDFAMEAGDQDFAVEVAGRDCAMEAANREYAAQVAGQECVGKDAGDAARGGGEAASENAAGGTGKNAAQTAGNTKEDAAKSSTGEKESTAKDFLRAGWKLGKIRIKSRIIEYVYQVKENAVTEKRREND